MDRFQAISAFTQVVESGSFARAAERQGISVSAISRQVAQLEAHLDSRLLNRTTRRLSLTESGHAFFERSLQLLTDLAEAEEAVSTATIAPRGTLRLTAPTGFGSRYLAPVVADFGRKYPQLRFDIELSDRAVDLVDEGLDLAVRIGPIGSQALIGRKIGSSQAVCCASPAYVKRHPHLGTPEDLAGHACLTYAYSSIRDQWQFIDAAGKSHEVVIAGPARANNGAMLCALAVAGAGIILEPDFVVMEDVRAGRLVRVLPGYAPRSIDIHAVYPSRRHLSAKVRAFVDFVAQRFARDPAWRLAPSR